MAMESYEIPPNPDKSYKIPINPIINRPIISFHYGINPPRFLVPAEVLCREAQPSPRWKRRHFTVSALPLPRSSRAVSKALSMNFFPGKMVVSWEFHGAIHIYTHNYMCIYIHIYI